jgi:hypothetical protein
MQKSPEQHMPMAWPCIFRLLAIVVYIGLRSTSVRGEFVFVLRLLLYVLPITAKGVKPTV